MGTFEKELIIAAVLMIMSVAASKASSRFGIPALLVFLLIGMGAGTHGLNQLPEISYDYAQQLGIFALIFILFSGGMDTQLKSVRFILKPALVLSTLGVLISALLVGLFAQQFFGLTLIEGCLLGATVSSTDVAAVFTVLRSKHVAIKGGVGSLLELESALNDPMTVFLGVGFLGLVTHSEHSLAGMIPLFFEQMVFGALLGWGFGEIAVRLINRVRLEFEGLYPVLSIGWILLTYAATQFVGGSGFLAVYVAGVVLGNSHLLHKRSLIHFHEGIAWLMQIAMFLAMGLLVHPSEIIAIAPWGLALSAFLILIARPASVFLSFLVSRFGWREKIMISWSGLRGAVPIILATYPFVAKIPQASTIFNLVFFVTFISVLLQGTTIPFAAQLLKVGLPFKDKTRFPIEFNPTRDLKNNLVEVTIPQGSPILGKSLIDLHLPKDVLIVLIQRGEEVLVPRGETQLLDGDALLVLAETDSLESLKKIL